MSSQLATGEAPGLGAAALLMAAVIAAIAMEEPDLGGAESLLGVA